MIISLNWLKQFTEIDGSIEDLVTLIGARLVEVEEVIDLGAKYQDVIVVKVVECSKVEDSDHLNLTKIDDGGKAQDVERDENGLVQVVCGAPNVREGLLVAWLPPGSTVPESFSDREPFVLGARKLRGYMSNGMLASAKELDLFEDHSGILEIDKDAAPGTSFAELYELNDYLLDIENKSLTHRPDCFGVIGFAREVAAIQNKQFVTPDWMQALEPVLGDKSEQVIEAPMVTIDDAALSDRYQALVLAGADGSITSPLQIQTYLSRVGVRPISAVVDTTNYLMLVTGQPLHAFDYDKLVVVGGKSTADIHVRAARAGEKLDLLDGRSIEMDPGDIVVASGDTAVTLAGAMGGASTVIDDHTKTIIIESATFNLYNLRATQMRHGIFSEAITRFTKGQPAELTAPVLASATRLIMGATGAERVSDIVEAYPGRRDPATFIVNATTVNSVLGTSYDERMIEETLSHVEFNVDRLEEGELQVTAPYWRSDIHINEDIIEEVGRIRGYDYIPLTRAKRDFTAVMPGEYELFRQKLRDICARAGANETLTYSFVHGDLLEKAGQKTADSYRITNSLSPSLQYYRQTLTPSLLALVQQNIKAGFDSLSVFELNKTHNKIHGLDDEQLPGELNMMAMVISSKKAKPGSAFYDARKYLDFIASSLGLNFVYTVIESDPGYPVTAPFDWPRSAYVTEKNSGEFIGIIGEYRASVKKAFKLSDATAGFEIGPEAILKALAVQPAQYSPLSRFPGTERDICFKVTESTTYLQLENAIIASLDSSDLDVTVELIDVYQAKNEPTKNSTVKLKINSSDHTLAAQEITSLVEQVTKHVIDKLQASVV